MRIALDPTSLHHMHSFLEWNAEPLVDSFPYAASVTASFMTVSNSIGVNFPSRRCCRSISP